MIRRMWRTASTYLVIGLVMFACAPSVRATETPPDQAALQKQLDEARARLDADARDVARLSTQLYGGPQVQIVKMLEGGRQGAMLGINIGGARDLDAGVEVVGVSPGGPAESAGLRAGDVIIAVDGERLRKSDGRSAGAQLVEYMRKAEPGHVVKVQYLRDGKPVTADVKTSAPRPLIEEMLAGRHLMPMDMMGLPGEGPMPFVHELLAGPGFGSLELVPVTPGLGRYFGTDKGLLVVRAPSEPGLGLEDGDVLLSIDGRTPDSPGQAFRILRSYDSGDKVKLSILRNHKRSDIEATLPATPPAHGHAPGMNGPVPAPRPAVPAPKPMSGKGGTA